MKKTLFLLMMPVLAGCLVSHPPEVAEWPVDWPLEGLARESAEIKTGGEVARLSQLVVLAPYDQRDLQVLRGNGTLATDPYNSFVALPSQALKGPALEALNASGKLGMVVGGASSARASRTLELTVTTLRLNCTPAEGLPVRRVAEAAVTVLVLSPERAIERAAQGQGCADAADGNYGVAFSRAFAKAVSEALKNL